MNRFLELLKSFYPFNVVGGREEIGKFAAEKLKPYSNEVYIDALGSVIAVKNGINKKAPRVKVEAHIDGVGLMIKHIESNGFLTAPDGIREDLGRAIGKEFDRDIALANGFDVRSGLVEIEEPVVDVDVGGGVLLESEVDVWVDDDLEGNSVV